MLPAWSALLDGVSLEDIDPRIRLVDITEEAPVVTTITAPGLLANGERLLGTHRERLSIRLSFRVLERDLTARTELLERVRTWACGTTLQVGFRPGRVLRGACEVLPASGSAMDWQAALSLRFTARLCPYWQSLQETSVSLTTADGNVKLSLPGNGPAVPLSFMIRNTSSATVTRITVRAGGQVITLEDSALLGAGLSLTLTYDDSGLMRIRRGSSSILSLRSDDSADDLLVTPGVSNTITLQADQPVTAAFRARGCWL